MRKKLLTAAAIVLALLFSFIGYLHIRQQQSYKNSVHKQANAIIKINTDKIIQSLIWDYITNSADIFEFKKKGKKLKNGIEIPANIFIYNLSDKSSDTFFCKLGLSDSALFKDFVSKKLGIQSFKKTPDAILGFSKNNTLTIAYSDKTVVIAFSLKKENITGTLLEILDPKNMLNEEDSRFDRLKESEDHITFIQNENCGGLNFEDEQLSFHATIISPEDFKPAGMVKHSRFLKESSIKMWLGADFNLRNKSSIFSIKAFNFHKDSLLKYYKGYMEASLAGTAIQQDTVVSYEYNDDFEKVETINIVNKQVPGICISFKSDASGLSHYLQNQNIIQGKGMVNKKLFPLYNLYSSVNPDCFNIGTAEKNSLDNKEERSDLFFYLFADFDRLKNEKHFPLINKYIEKLAFLEMKAKKEKKNINLSGHLSFSDKKNHAFRQVKAIIGM